MAKRTICLNLTDADCGALMEKAVGAGMTVEQLLESFIADLICGEGTNGSDERDLASAWFDRAGFARLNERRTFTAFLVRRGGIMDALNIVEKMGREEAELAELDAEAETDPELWKINRDYREDTREYAEALRTELETIYYDPYNDSFRGRGAPSFEEALEDLRGYQRRLSAFQAEAGKEAETRSALPDEDSIGQGKAEE